MKNKEFYKLLKKNKSNPKSDSGFTLTELLVGLIMSIFVIGALGFGLMQVLRFTQKGSSETLVRNEAGRALDFISDEMRRSESMEVDTSDINIDALGGSDYTGKKKSGATVRLALDIPGVDAPVIYSVAPNTSPWKGPLVIYRWGPNLDANGNYTDPTNSGTWSNQALVDGISDVDQTAIGCDMDGDTNDDTYKGFYACVDDPDGDGLGIFAQLYFTGETKDGTSVGTNTYSADTKTVARARTAPASSSPNLLANTMSFRTLNPSFACDGSSNWKMRTDFGSSSTTPSSLTKWNHDDDRQPQPIKITGETLTISSIPRDASGTCLNKRVNNGRETNDPSTPRDFSGNKTLSEQQIWKDDSIDLTDVVAVTHVIDFGDPTTFNGDIKDSCDANYACGGSVKINNADSDDVNTSVLMLKRGSIVPDYGGYDANNNGSFDDGEQKSLGAFLADKGLAKNIGTVEAPEYQIIAEQEIGKPLILGKDERIIAFEIGYDVSENTTPDNIANTGIDFQDNIFIVQSNKFIEKQFDSYTVGTSTP